MSAVPKAKFTTPVRPLTFLITSCSSGLGLCLARAVQGATSRKPGRTPDLVAKVERRGGPFEIIFFGLPRLARAAVAHMRRRRFGVVVNMSSGAGLEGVESMGAYAAAKSALNGEFGFRTNMRNVARIGSVPLADDHKGKEFAETARVVARIVTGTGVGEGREGETFLPLGKDVIPTYSLVMERLNHALKSLRTLPPTFTQTTEDAHFGFLTTSSASS
ncbi:hypothetical protein RB597_006600 [Gaeumannomyces tritici]